MSNEPWFSQRAMIETAGDVHAFLARVQYRPGWRLTVEVDPHFGVRLHLRAWVHDSFHRGEQTFRVTPGEPPPDFSLAPRSVAVATPKPRIECDIPAVEIHAWWMVRLPMDEDELLHMIRGRLAEVELHERDEWLRLDDKMPFNPHLEEAK